MQLINKKNKYILLLWLCLTSTAPFIFFSWPGHPYKFLTFFCLSLMTLLIVKRYNQPIFDFKIFSILLIQIAFYLFATFYHGDSSNLNLIIQLVSLFLIISFVNGYIGFESFAKSYINVMLIMGIGGTIMFFLHLLIGITPMFSVDYSETGTSYFLGLTTTNVYWDISNIRILRYSGFFDEPGTFSLYSLFAIILNRAFFKEKNIELWLIGLTIFTFSLSFYFVMIFYFLFFYLNLSNVKYFILTIFLITASFFYLDAHKENESLKAVYDFTFQRFEMDDSGSGLAKNNRSELSSHDKNVFFNNPLLGVGLAKEEVWGSNFYSIFARYGIVGSLFYYSLLVYLLFLIILLERKKRTIYLKILFIILINFYHRPEMSSVFALLFFVALIIRIRVDLLEQENEYRITKLGLISLH